MADAMIQAQKWLQSWSGTGIVSGCGESVTVRYGMAYRDLHAGAGLGETAICALAKGNALCRPYSRSGIETVPETGDASEGRQDHRSCLDEAET